jgi:hypothetical protein
LVGAVSSVRVHPYLQNITSIEVNPPLLLSTNNPEKKPAGGDGAGFDACLFCGTDVGEPAPTNSFKQKI